MSWGEAPELWSSIQKDASAVPATSLMVMGRALGLVEGVGVLEVGKFSVPGVPPMGRLCFQWAVGAVLF